MSTFLLEVPFGRLFAEVTPRGLRRLEFLDVVREPALRRPPARDYVLDGGPVSAGEREIAGAVEAQVREYCNGERRVFELPIDLGAGSEFRRCVWDVISGIGYGETLSYAEVAAAAGNPNAYRAAGSACGTNPIVIVIPCHRVVGSDKRLHGFGGGLDLKSWLLSHETHVLAGRQPQLV